MEASVPMSDAPVCERDGWTMLKSSAITPSDQSGDGMIKIHRFPDCWICPVCCLNDAAKLRSEQPELIAKIKRVGLLPDECRWGSRPT